MKTISQMKTLPCNVSMYHYFRSSYIQFGKFSELQGTVLWSEETKALWPNSSIKTIKPKVIVWSSKEHCTVKQYGGVSKLHSNCCQRSY